MKRLPVGTVLFVLLVALIGFASSASGQKDGELPLHTQRLSDKVLFAWIGDYMQTIRVVALATARGIVVIEANLSRAADVRIRTAIEKEFGRKDIKYLINTHFHHDHTCGNQVYADADIVAHQSVPGDMKSEQTGEGLTKLVEMFKKDAQDWEERQSKAAPDSGEFHFFREGVALLKTTLAELQEGFRPTFPSILFDTRMVLDMGDMTLELYAVGGTHSKGDIMIFVPEEKLVAVGDMWPDQVLPYLRKDGPWNLDAILENWGRIVDSGREIRHVNMAHSDMKLEVETFRQQYRYLKTLWDGLRELRRKGMTLEEAKKAYTIEKDFPYFKERRLVVRDINIHENNVEAIWAKLAPPGTPAAGLSGASASSAAERPAGDQEAEKREIARVVSSVIGWAKDKNIDLFYGSIANDEDYISVTPTNRIVKHFEDVKQSVPFWMSPDFKYVRHELKDLEITFARCGTVAWFFCILDDINTYKGEPAAWENTRWTGVVEKRDGKWIVVSQHFSFASDKS